MYNIVVKGWSLSINAVKNIEGHQTCIASVDNVKSTRGYSCAGHMLDLLVISRKTTKDHTR